MTQFEFVLLCNEHLIYPALALENEAILEALKRNDDEKVKALFKTEF